MRHPIPDYLASLITELGAVNPGETAQYIPVLAEADPDRLGIALATPTGRLHSAGDADVEFTIQSASKPFTYAAALVDRTGAGPRTVSELRRELSATRRRGYAREIGSVSPDRSSVAAAVVDRHAHPVAAVAVTFDRIEVPAQEVAATVEQVRRVTAAIVAHLGGDAVRRGDWPAAP